MGARCGSQMLKEASAQYGQRVSNRLQASSTLPQRQLRKDAAATSLSNGKRHAPDAEYGRARN
eukprot:359140-Chlamydomonas_euryale.AAC.7